MMSLVNNNDCLGPYIPFYTTKFSLEFVHNITL